MDKNIRVRGLSNSWVLAFQIFNELIFVSWLHEEHKIYFHIIMSFTVVGILFFKTFFMLERNKKFMRIENESKQAIHAMDTHDSEYVMTCTTAINSISNTLKKLLVQSDLHSSYIKTRYNGKGESINNSFSTYIEPLLSNINHPALVQE